MKSSLASWGISVAVAVFVPHGSFADQDRFSISHYYRCHSIFTRERPSPGDDLLASVSRRERTSTEACMELFSRARFDESLTIADPERNAIGQKILRTFKGFHGTWFPNHLTYMTTDGPQTFDIVELEAPALFLTRALFDPAFEYRQIVRGSETYEGKRLSVKKPEYFIGSVPEPKIRIESRALKAGHENLVEWKPRWLERGVMVGLKRTPVGQDILPRSVNDLFFPKLSVEPVDIHASLGGGFMGTNSYLTFNMGRSLGDVSDGGNSLPRRHARNVIRDILCRELPVVKPEDTIPYLNEVTGVSWAGNKNCMSCHSTMDPMAALLRGAELVISHNDFGSYHVRFHKPVAKPDRKIVLGPAPEYHKTPPHGRFFSRSVSGRLIDRPVGSLDELGEEISRLDEFYQCATSRYLYFLTGIRVPVRNLHGEPLSVGSRKILGDFQKWSSKLRQTQRLDLLVKDIVDSEYFRSSQIDSRN
jgi:hypothetical protein